MKQVYRVLALVILLLVVKLPAIAQQQEIRPVPIVTGYTGFTATFEPGKQTLNPTMNPIFLIPLNKRLLIETEFEMESDFEREDGQWGPRVLEKDVEYLQLDYLANRHVTFVFGRFLTPFGIFNERLHPSWIKNLQSTPLIFGMSHGSGNGAMLRGGVELNSSVNLNYSMYFSALSTVKLLDSERSAGGRWSLFLKNQRFEFGGSFSRRLGEERFNMYGFDAMWNAKAVPLDVRAEFARSVLGSGYWLEGAYRLNRVEKWNSFFRRSQAVLRFEQFFAPAQSEEEGGEAMEGDEHSALPMVNTQRVMVGWNYYIRDGLKVSFGYGRSFTVERDRNIWSVGLSYRFLF